MAQCDASFILIGTFVDESLAFEVVTKVESYQNFSFESYIRLSICKILIHICSFQEGDNDVYTNAKREVASLRIFYHPMQECKLIEMPFYRRNISQRLHSQ